MLGNAEVMITKFCNLRQMGDADYLVMFGKSGKFFANNHVEAHSEFYFT
jgi:hypothetical protein